MQVITFMLSLVGCAMYELRPGSNRILFFFYDGERFVLLHGFRKKTQKTPRHEIDTARAQMDEYIRRNK